MSVKKKEFIFYSVLILVAVCFFGFLGKGGYYEYPDSWQYIEMINNQGVTPLYPLFIHAHRLLLGEELYLYGVVCSQAALSILCVIGFSVWVHFRFRTGWMVRGIIFLVSLVPFTVDYPDYISSHVILTEGLAYPLFYIFAIILFETMFRKKIGWVLGSGAMAVCMALIRTQMQLCFVICAAVWGYVVWTGKRSKGRVWVNILASVAGALVLVGVGEAVMLGINHGLQQIADRERPGIEASIDRTNIVAAAGMQAETRDEPETPDNSNVTSQFDSVLVDRTFYEMDAEDAELFEDPELQALFWKVFEAADQNRSRYVYARNGLWKWQDIMNGTCDGTYMLGKGWESFREEFPESPLLDNQVQAKRAIAFTLLRAHWPRMLYHTLCILPQGFICTVFFQIEKIYGLCHLYTLLVYAGAVVLTIWGQKRKDIFGRRGEFLLGAVALNVLMVIITSVVFFGMQRYLIYGFGIFYAACVLMLEPVVRNVGRKIWKKHREH